MPANNTPTTPYAYPRLMECFPEIFEKNISEKTIMYMMRNVFAINLDSSPQNQKFKNYRYEFAKEFEHMLFSYRYDWRAVDIDNNILLTYPVYLSVDNLVEKMLWDPKAPYQLKEYNKNVSEALSSSVSGNNAALFEKIMTAPNIHPHYLRDMVLGVMEFYMYKPERYQKLLDKINFKAIDAKELCYTLFKQELATRPDYTPLQTFLKHYPLSSAQRLEYLSGAITQFYEEQGKIDSVYLKASQAQLQKLLPLNIWLEKLTLEHTSLSNSQVSDLPVKTAVHKL